MTIRACWSNLRNSGLALRRQCLPAGVRTKHYSSSEHQDLSQRLATGRKVPYNEKEKSGNQYKNYASKDNRKVRTTNKSSRLKPVFNDEPALLNTTSRISPDQKSQNEVTDFIEALKLGNLRAAWVLYAEAKQKLSRAQVTLLTNVILAAIRKEIFNVQDSDVQQGIEKTNLEAQKYVSYLSQLIQDMKNLQLAVSDRSALYLISSLRDLKQYEMAIDLWNWLKNQSFDLNLSYAAMIDLYSSLHIDDKNARDQLKKCEELFSAYLKTEHQPSAIVYSAIGYARAHLNDINGAVQMWDIINDKNLLCNQTFRLVNEILANSEDLLIATRFFNLAIEQQFKIGSHPMAKYINHSFKQGVPERAIMSSIQKYLGQAKNPATVTVYLEFLNQFFIRYPTPSTAQIFTLSEFTQSLYGRAQHHDGIHPAVFNTLLTRVRDVWQRHDIFDTIWNGINAQAIKPSIVSYRIALIHYARERDFGKVHEVWNSLVNAENELNNARQDVWDKNFEHLIHATMLTDDVKFLNEQFTNLGYLLSEPVSEKVDVLVKSDQDE
ncbi:hypothetical protein V1514DRAFT_352839 [Lipomyces japonicus]|uniref:uncharacterized protein n=1 Tax=Lipomyces japonicus TaxID=56871 RepID=UPI0034CF39FF